MSTRQFKKRKNKFKQIGFEMDCYVFERTFTGRMTEKRKEIIQKFCDRHLYYISDCGCSHDCCGCLLREVMEFTYRQNQVVITRSLFYNY